MPDNTVKVTISAQDEATAILRKVQQELAALKGVTNDLAKSTISAGEAAKSTGGSFLGMVSELKQLAVAYGALKVIDYINSTIQSAAALERLAEMTGVSTEKLSVFKVASDESGVSMDLITAALRKFATVLGQIETGGRGGTLAAYLQAIGLSAKDLQGLSLDQALLKVVDAMGKYKDGANKMAVANALFGRSGSELIPLFAQLQDGGFAKLEEHAQATGQILSTAAAKDAKEFAAAMGDVKGSIEGLAHTIEGSGILHLLAQIGEALAKAIGYVQRSPALLTTIPVVGPFLAAAIGSGNARAAAAQQLPTLAPVVATSPDSRPDIDLSRVAGRAKLDQEQLQTLEQNAQERLAIVKREAASEYQEFQSYAKLGEQIEAERFRQGLISITAYYAQRRRAIADGYNAEVQELTKDMAAVRTAAAEQARALRAAEPDSTLAPAVQAAQREKNLRQATKIEHDAQLEIADLQDRINRGKIDAQDQTNVLKAQEVQEQQRILDAVTAIQDRIRSARGDARAVAQSQIEKEVRDAGVTLGQAGSLTPAELAQDQDRLDTLRSSLELQQDFAEAQRQAQQIQADIANQTKVIQDRMKGIGGDAMSQVEGERAIAQLEASRVPQLQAIAEKMASIAQQLGNPQLANEARALSVSIGNMGHQTDEAATASANLGSNIADVARSGLIEYFGSGISRANGFASALQGVVGQIQQLIAKAFVLQALKILGLGGGAAVGGGATAVSGGLGAALAAGAFAEGGLVRGPGTSTSDSVLARLSAGEYVMSASSVSRHGAAFFSALNAGAAARPRMRAGLPGFAEGGLVTHAAGAAGAGRLDVHLTLDKGLILDTFDSSAGHRLIINALGKNPKAARGALRLG